MKIAQLALVAVSSIASAYAAKPSPEPKPETIACGATLAPNKVTELQEDLICPNDTGVPALVIPAGATLVGNGFVIYGRSSAPTPNKPIQESKEDDVAAPALELQAGEHIIRIEGLEIRGFETGAWCEGTNVQLEDVKFTQMKKFGLHVEGKPDIALQKETPFAISIIDSKFESIGLRAIDIQQTYATLDMKRTDITDIGSMATELGEQAAAIRIRPLQRPQYVAPYKFEDVNISASQGIGIWADNVKYTLGQMLELEFPEPEQQHSRIELEFTGKNKLDFIDQSALEWGNPEASSPTELEEKEILSKFQAIMIRQVSTLEISASARGMNLLQAQLSMEDQAKCKVCLNGPLANAEATEQYDLEIMTADQLALAPTAELYYEDKEKLFTKSPIKDQLFPCQDIGTTTVELAEAA